MVDMGVTQKHISRRDCRMVATNLFAERNNPGAGIEDAPMTCSADFNARGVAAEFAGRTIGGWIASAHAPKTDGEYCVFILGCAHWHSWIDLGLYLKRGVLEKPQAP